MRLIATIDNADDAYEFSGFLISQGLENSCEPVPSEGGPSYAIWVLDESKVEESMRWYRSFSENPNDPRFRGHKIHRDDKKQKESSKKGGGAAKQPRSIPFGKLTLSIIAICVMLFVVVELSVVFKNVSSEKTYVTKLVSPVMRTLLYDFPDYYTPSQWSGFYEEFMLWYHDKEHYSFPEVMLFKKISDGEVWRLFTPCLLHGDLFHILFNMLWVFILCNQIEQRIGIAKALALIITTGIVSNTVQYLVSGPFFIGFSGVVCGMVAFIWMRHRQAPWEGYPLPSSSIHFIAFFVFALFVIGTISFSAQIFGYSLPFALNIANTAHISGGVAGALIGKTNLLKAR
ncbi:MAG: rhomboid family intramembrane serine protease [Waddliaceae bacterium]|jgi:GlpG protein|nr:rhomboid family intramembrane serine protease [Waddliaceae bacterium]MBT3578513.1 rhomboid family intramembrane serine protease [Waddliaceae bacterium]MBT4444899.1 rhomboid family intramembrane serine protease [Waddliaceae bacterium]MBT6928735.1 rhomboid family intramembrane serine protease [Waddliaceae bacterium]MBT7264753.1 rhomboid family intramembrane serine protease [Waddliaceae bacterium]